MNDALAWAAVVGGALGGAAALFTALRYHSIESFRAKLRAEGLEHEIRFARLHERRVDVVAELYEKLVDAERAFASWVSPMQEAGEPSKSEKGKAAGEAGNALRTFFLRNRIWLDEALCAQIADIDKRLFGTSVRYTMYHPEDSSTRTEYLEQWQKAWHDVQDDIPPLREAIERRFREMLGVTAAAP